MKDIKRKIKKRVKGITLIALIITIVIILILAGVTIAFTIGPNGIIQQAQNAKNRYQLAAQSESTVLDTLNNQIDSGNFSSLSTADLATVTKIPDSATSTQATNKDNNVIYYKDDTSLNNKDLTNTTSDTTKVTISNGKTIDDYKVYYKAATADNISAGAAGYADGNLILGNGADVDAAYQRGKSEATISVQGVTFSNIAFLGSGSSFNVSSYSNYGTYTADNFIVSINSLNISGHHDNNVSEGSDGSKGSTITKSYNASTGVFTVGGTSTSFTNYTQYGGNTLSCSGAVSVSVYLLY